MFRIGQKIVYVDTSIEDLLYVYGVSIINERPWLILDKLTVGKIYEVQDKKAYQPVIYFPQQYDKGVCVMDDSGKLELFEENRFETLKEHRKQKLNKLNIKL